MMIDGKWVGKWDPVQKSDAQGRFVRQTSSFRNWITQDGSAGPTGTGGYKAEAGRYRLYVAYICPWASRTLIARSLKGLEELIPISVVSPILTDEGWGFGNFAGATSEPLHGAQYMHELYAHADPGFNGRATVPLLWDTHTDTAVNNESADILRMFNSAFDELVPDTPDLYPADLASQIDDLNALTYARYNNGVYKCGFASSQEAYDEAHDQLFEEVDRLEVLLSDGRPFFLGDRLTEADIRIFVTSIRFDAAYHGLFKCNRNALRDFPFMHAHMSRVLKTGRIAETVRLDHIQNGYYSILALNPTGIVPRGPAHIHQLLKDHQS